MLEVVAGILASDRPEVAAVLQGACERHEAAFLGFQQIASIRDATTRVLAAPLGEARLGILRSEGRALDATDATTLAKAELHSRTSQSD